MALINDAEDDYGNKIGTIETAVSMDEFFPDMYRGGERVWSCFVSADGQVAADDRAASESPGKRRQLEWPPGQSSPQRRWR